MMPAYDDYWVIFILFTIFRVLSLCHIENLYNSGRLLHSARNSQVLAIVRELEAEGTLLFSVVFENALLGKLTRQFDESFPASKELILAW